MVSVGDGGYISEFFRILCGLRHLVFGNDEFLQFAPAFSWAHWHSVLELKDLEGDGGGVYWFTRNVGMSGD